ncbi:uncharacterized protein LOC144439694 isoform X2 [Glandiceps talaboti]
MSSEDKGEKQDKQQPIHSTEMATLLVAPDWLPRTPDSSTSFINRDIALLQTTGNGKVYSLLNHDATDEEIKDAEEYGVELICPKPDEKVKRLKISPTDWFLLCMEYFPHLKNYIGEISLVIGHADCSKVASKETADTVSAAARIKEKFFPSANLGIAIHYIPELMYDGKALQDAEKEVLDAAKVSQLILSISRTIHSNFQTKFMAIPTQHKQFEHIWYIPIPDERVLREPVSIHELPKHIDVLSTVATGSAADWTECPVIAKGLGSVAYNYRFDNDVKLTWKICNCRDEGYKKTSWNLKKYISCEYLDFNVLPDLSNDDFHTYLRQCSLLLEGNEAKAFSLPAYHAIVAGLPTLCSSKSGVANLILSMEATEDYIYNISVETRADITGVSVSRLWGDKILQMFRNYSTTLTKAGQLREALTKSILEGEIYQQRQIFQEWCRTSANAKSDEKESTGTSSSRQCSTEDKSKPQVKETPATRKTGKNGDKKSDDTGSPAEKSGTTGPESNPIENGTLLPIHINVSECKYQGDTDFHQLSANEIMEVEPALFDHMTTPADLSTMVSHIEMNGDAEVQSVYEGNSLTVLIKCLTMVAVERLWTDMWSGKLTQLAQKDIVTEQALHKLNASHITIQADIRTWEYKTCKAELRFAKALHLQRSRPIETTGELQHFEDSPFSPTLTQMTDVRKKITKSKHSETMSSFQVKDVRKNSDSQERLKVVSLKLDKKLECQRFAKKYLHQILKTKKCRRLKGRHSDFLQVVVKMTARIQHILDTRQEMLALLGIKKYLVTEMRTIDLTVADLEELFIKQANNVLSIATTNRPLSFLSKCFMQECPLHVEVHTGYVLDIAQNRMQVLKAEKRRLLNQLSKAETEKSAVYQKYTELKGSLEESPARSSGSSDSMKHKILQNQLDEARQENAELQQQRWEVIRQKNIAEKRVVSQLVDIHTFKYTLKSNTAKLEELESQLKQKQQLVSVLQAKLSVVQQFIFTEHSKGLSEEEVTELEERLSHKHTEDTAMETEKSEGAFADTGVKEAEQTEDDIEEVNEADRVQEKSEDIDDKENTKSDKDVEDVKVDTVERQSTTESNVQTGKYDDTEVKDSIKAKESLKDDKEDDIPEEPSTSESKKQAGEYDDIEVKDSKETEESLKDDKEDIPEEPSTTESEKQTGQHKDRGVIDSKETMETIKDDKDDDISEGPTTLESDKQTGESGDTGENDNKQTDETGEDRTGRPTEESSPSESDKQTGEGKDIGVKDSKPTDEAMEEKEDITEGPSTMKSDKQTGESEDKDNKQTEEPSEEQKGIAEISTTGSDETAASGNDMAMLKQLASEIELPSMEPSPSYRLPTPLEHPPTTRTSRRQRRPDISKLSEEEQLKYAMKMSRGSQDISKLSEEEQLNYAMQMSLGLQETEEMGDSEFDVTSHPYEDRTSQWSKDRIGQRGEGSVEFNSPSGMAMTPTDLLLVCEYGNQRIQILNKEFQCLDFITYTDEFPQPFKPWDIAVSHDNLYFIYDDGNKQIIVTNQNKKIIRIICQNEDLWGITVMGNFVLATDFRGHRLIKFTTMGDKVTEVKGQVQSEGQFSDPWSVAVTSDQKVVMSHSKGINFYDSNLKFISSYDHSFNATGQCVDKRNNIYICDWGNNRVVMVTENREFVVVHSDIVGPRFIEISDEKTTKIFITHVYDYDYITVLIL